MRRMPREFANRLAALAFDQKEFAVAGLVALRQYQQLAVGRERRSADIHFVLRRQIVFDFTLLHIPELHPAMMIGRREDERESLRDQGQAGIGRNCQTEDPTFDLPAAQFLGGRTIPHDHLPRVVTAEQRVAVGTQAEPDDPVLMGI